MNAVKWVLIDSTEGATTQDGSVLSPAVLNHIAEAVQDQVNREFAAEWGAQATIRLGTLDAVQSGECAYGFVATIPDDPAASAYHALTLRGIPFAMCAVTTCGSLLGPDGVSVDASHEILETAGDEGANQFANDNNGLLHAVEMCDAVEIQTYPKTCQDGTVVQVSNWLLRAWFDPGASGPYDYMTLAGLDGAVAPPGPLQTAAGQDGNYQIISRWGGDSPVFAAARHIVGTRRKGPNPKSISRAGKRLLKIAELDRLAKTR